MRRSHISEAIRRAALIPFTFVACGGSTAATTGGDGGSGDSSVLSDSSAPEDSGTPLDSATPQDSATPEDAAYASDGPMTQDSQSTQDSASPNDAQPPQDASIGCKVASTTPVTMSLCAATYTLVGNGSACRPDPDGGVLPGPTCAAVCPPYPPTGGVTAVFCDVVSGNPATINCNYGPCATGRRPEGLAPGDQGGGAAGYLAATAWLEAASVAAFERLARELEAHAAPARLRRAARRAARDEIRHARRVGAFAERAGAAVPPVHVEPRPVRSLEAIAIENAVEGCVRETFGAAVAAVQAARASSRSFRAAMKGIARDEARHAKLSWDVARWLEPQLDEAARQRVKAARDGAAEALLREASVEPDPGVTRDLGVPRSQEARAMVQSLSASLWS